MSPSRETRPDEDKCGLDTEAWPNCRVPDCENKATLWMPTGMCFPHSTGISLTWMREMSELHGARPWPEPLESWVQRRSDRAEMGLGFDPLEGAKP